MKTKTIISFLSLCALLAFTGCEKNATDELLPGANLSIRLCVDGPAMTRTTASSTVADESTESAITSLDICLISKTGLSSASPVTTINDPRKVAWKPLTGDVTGAEYEVNVIVPETLTGDYLLYVIANKPSWMTISTYGDICGTFTGTKANLSACWADNSFLMINAQDANTTSGDQAGVSVTMAPLSTDDKVEKTVTIERLATKIRVKKNTKMQVAPLLTEVLCTDPEDDTKIKKGAIAAMDLKGYALFNCVNSFNLVQQWKAGTTSGQLLVSPSSYIGVESDHSDAYGIDEEKHFTEGYYDNVPASLTFSDMGTALYCMENNSPYYADLVSSPGDASSGTKMKGRVTGLVFKAQAGYVKDYNGLVDILESLGIDPNEAPWQTTKGSSDIIYGTLYQYKGNYYGDIPCLLKSNYPALVYDEGLSSSSTVDQLREAGVKVYEGGYMYYNYWIEDKNYKDNGKNYLSVMRNTFYDINITAINSLGDEFPCGGTGYTKIDPISIDVPKLSVSMDIPDWTDKEGNYVIQ